MQPGMAKLPHFLRRPWPFDRHWFLAKANFARMIPPARFRRRRHGRSQGLSNFQPEFDAMPRTRHGAHRAEDQHPMLSGQRAPRCRMTACGKY
jgi:hypothetical protein